MLEMQLYGISSCRTKPFPDGKNGYYYYCKWNFNFLDRFSKGMNNLPQTIVLKRMDVVLRLCLKIISKNVAF